MEKDNTTTNLGIIYLVITCFIWVNSFSVRGDIPYYPWVFQSWGGILVIIGSILLIPIFLLTIFFITLQNSTCETVAFGLAIPSWVFILSGATVGLYFTTLNYLTPILFIVLIFVHFIIGFGLYIRRNFYKPIAVEISPLLSYNNPFISQANQNRQVLTPLSQSQNRRRAIKISNKIRIASTSGQSLKKCIQCGHTLDIKTKICYFCGAPQPEEYVNRPISPHLPPEFPQPPSSLQKTTPKDEFHYCPNCGAAILRGHLFCPECGASLD